MKRGMDPARERRKQQSVTLKIFLNGEYRRWAIANLRAGDVATNRLLAAFSDISNLSLSEISSWNLEKWIAGRKRRSIKASTINREIATRVSRLTGWKPTRDDMFSTHAEILHQNGWRHDEFSAPILPHHPKVHWLLT